MARIKRGVTTRAKHKRILDNAKGYYGRRKNTIRIVFCLLYTSDAADD